MRWSLLLSALIAVQSATSFVCVALSIPPQSDVLERRSPAGGLKLSSKKYRENSKTHPDAYHVEGLGPNGKITAATTVRKEKLSKDARSDHAKNLLDSKDPKIPIHAGMLLRDVRGCRSYSPLVL
jgi:hypothetical protein